MSKTTDFMGTVMDEFYRQHSMVKLINMSHEAVGRAMDRVAREMGGRNVKVTRIHDSISINCDPPEGWVYATPGPTAFQKDLEALINKHSVENQSSTPDFILAEYLTGCLEVFNKTVIKRSAWYGREAGKPGCMEQPISTGGAAG